MTVARDPQHRDGQTPPPANGGTEGLHAYLIEVARAAPPTPEEEHALVARVVARRAELQETLLESGLAIDALLRGEIPALRAALPAHRAALKATLESCRAAFAAEVLGRNGNHADPGHNGNGNGSGGVILALHARLREATAPLAAIPIPSSEVRAVLETMEQAAGRMEALAATHAPNEAERTELRRLLVEAIDTPHGHRNRVTSLEASRDILATARQRLCERFLREVLPLAKRFAAKGPPLADLLQEGNTALVVAAERFRPSEGGRFRDFARSRIREAMRRFLVDRSPLIPGIRDEILSLDEPIDDSEDLVLADLVRDPNAADPIDVMQEELLHARIEEVLRTLSIRERNVLRLRYGLGRGHSHTLDEVARILRVSRRRIEKIQSEALRKLGRPDLRARLAGFLPHAAACR